MRVQRSGQLQVQDRSNLSYFSSRAPMEQLRLWVLLLIQFLPSFNLASYSYLSSELIPRHFLINFLYIEFHLRVGFPENLTVNWYSLRLCCFVNRWKGKEGERAEEIHTLLSICKLIDPPPSTPTITRLPLPCHIAARYLLQPSHLFITQGLSLVHSVVVQQTFV